MIRHRRISALLVAALMVALLIPVPAFAAVENGTVEVQIWPDGQPGYTLLIVTMELAEDVELPADVALPLPDGAQVIWAGEIMGGGPESDIQVTPEIVDGEAGPAVKMTLQTARTAQYEAVYTPLVENGDEISTSLDWFQSVPSESVFFSVRIPPNTGTVRMTPPESGIPQTNEFGERLFTVAPLAIPVGEHFTVDVSYDLVSLVTSGDGDDGSDMLLPILGGALVIVVAVLLIVMQQQRAAAVAAAREDEYEGVEADAEDDLDLEFTPPPAHPVSDDSEDDDDDAGFLD